MTVRLTALALCFLAFTAFSRHATRPEQVPPRQSLADMPLSLGRWSGQDGPPFSREILGELGVDDYITRIYQAGPRDVVSLYIGYYKSQRSGDTIHSPMNCLPGAGWQPTQTSYVHVDVPGRPAPITIKRVLIEKGIDRQVVLYWYHSHGRVIGSEYWSKAFMIYDALRLNRSDAALVRVVSPVGLSDGAEEQADARATEFVQTMFGQLDAYLPS
jgi:EpsI family protein